VAVVDEDERAEVGEDEDPKVEAPLLICAALPDVRALDTDDEVVLAEDAVEVEEVEATACERARAGGCDPIGSAGGRSMSAHSRSNTGANWSSSCVCSLCSAKSCCMMARSTSRSGSARLLSVARWGI
jgi:hypothetical protein